MKITSLALAASILLFLPTVHSMYQQPPMPYDNADQQSAVQFGPFQSYQPPTPTAPPAAPRLEDSTHRRARVQHALNMQPRDADRVLIESIGSAHAVSTMSSKLALVLGGKLILDYYLTGNKLASFDPATVIHLVTDNVLVLGALGAALGMESKRKKAETALINLLHRLDRFDAHLPAHTVTEHTKHPSYTRYSSLITEDETEQNQGHDEETPLTALQIQHTKDIALLRENGFLEAKTRMWILIALLFASNALRDCLYFDGQGYIPAGLIAANGLGTIGSLLLAQSSSEQQEAQEQKISVHVQGTSAVQEDQ